MEAAGSILGSVKRALVSSHALLVAARSKRRTLVNEPHAGSSTPRPQLASPSLVVSVVDGWMDDATSMQHLHCQDRWQTCRARAVKSVVSLYKKRRCRRRRASQVITTVPANLPTYCPYHFIRNPHLRLSRRFHPPSQRYKAAVLVTNHALVCITYTYIISLLLSLTLLALHPRSTLAHTTQPPWTLRRQPQPAQR